MQFSPQEESLANEVLRGLEMSYPDLRDILSSVGSASARRPMLRLVATFLRRFCAFLVALTVSSSVQTTKKDQETSKWGWSRT